MSGAILSVNPTESPDRWTLPVRPELCAGLAERPVLFGGSALAACVAAMQATVDLPLIWTTAQYLSYASPGEELSLQVRQVARGKYTAQVQVTASVGDRVIVIAQGALGQRPDPDSRQFNHRETPPAPEVCAPLQRPTENPAGINRHFEFRLIEGRYPVDGEEIDGPSDGRLSLWIRPLGQVTLDACWLAVLTDFVFLALTGAAGRLVHGSSIDNTLRLGPIVPSEWLLCDIAIDAVHAGVAHGHMRLSAQGGRLMALSTTSLIMRTPSVP